jgi:hypothetical protein
MILTKSWRQLPEFWLTGLSSQPGRNLLELCASPPSGSGFEGGWVCVGLLEWARRLDLIVFVLLPRGIGKTHLSTVPWGGAQGTHAGHSGDTQGTLQGTLRGHL